MLGQDLRYALRLLVGNPGFAIVALLTMALGIGANTAIFSVIDTVLLRPAPVKDIDALAVVWETDRNTSTTREPASLPDFLDYQQRSQRVEQIAAFHGQEVNYTPEQGEAIRLQALGVTDGLLPMLGVRPLAGRGFTPEEARAGGPAVVVISEGFWTRAFGRDTSAVGRTIRLDDRPFTVIGIMERGSDFGIFQILTAADYSRAFADRGARAAVDVWLPFQHAAQTMPRSTHPIFMVARMRGSVAAVQEELAAISSDLERAYPENRARGVFVEPLSAVVFGPVRPALLVLPDRCRPRAARRVRERGQPAPGPRHRAAPRSGGAHRAWCDRVAVDASVRGRRPAARRGCGGLWRGAGRARCPGAGRARSRRHPTHRRRVGGSSRARDHAARGDRRRAARSAWCPRSRRVAWICRAHSRAKAATADPLAASARGFARSLVVVGVRAGGDAGHRRDARSSRASGGSSTSTLASSPRASSRRSISFRSAGIRSTSAASRTSRRCTPSPMASCRTAERLPGVDAAAVAGNHPLDPGFTNSFRIIGREAEAPHAARDLDPPRDVRLLQDDGRSAGARPAADRRRHDDRAARRRHQRGRGAAILRRTRNRSASRSTSGARRGRSSASSATSDSRASPRRLRSRRMRRSTRRRRRTAQACSSCAHPAIRRRSSRASEARFASRIPRWRCSASSRSPRRCPARSPSAASRCSSSGCSPRSRSCWPRSASTAC